jgi:hypothetical protein
VFRRRTNQPEVLDQEALEPDAPPGQDATQGAAEDAGQVSRPGVTPGKGRPTPKRSEAERRRRSPYAAPSDRKDAARQSRDRDRNSRSNRMAAMKRGEEWALPAKDRGPVRALARDVVDSRRGLSENYLYFVAVLIALLFVPALRGSLIVDYLVLLILVMIVGEGWYVGRKVLRLALQRYPGESTRGVKLYAAMRGTQIRRMRMPAPRVKPGDKI